jgi:hypothetical protein
MTWPTNLLDPAYATAVLAAVTAGNYELTWTPITATDAGHTIEFLFSARPLRVGGVFVNVSATLQQQLADLLGALLPTPKVMDLAWLGRAATILPFTMPIAATSAAMVTASSALDSRIEAAGNPQGPLALQKTWCIGNSLLAHPGKAMNYGFFCIPNQPNNYYSGIGTEACVSFPLDPKRGRVIQGQGWAHDPSHCDYSQACPLLHRSCKVDGVDSDLATVLQDKTLAPLLSHEGALQALRQPGVPLYACAVTPKAMNFAPANEPWVCPTPPRPTNIETRKTDWGLVTFTTIALAGVVGGFWWMLRNAGRAAA